MRCLPPSPRPLVDALALGPALLARARSSRTPWMAASLIDGPAIVLGAAQIAGRVVDLGAATAPALRRSTSGTAVFLGSRALLWTLALPHVAALAPDATARTLLNRNVRGFLRGLARAGAPAHYFGREWITVAHRPAVVLAFEATRDGAILLEAWAGCDVPLAIPPHLAAPEERALDRWLGKPPAALADVLPAHTRPESLAQIVMESVALRAGAPLEEGDAPLDLERDRFAPITSLTDPLPRGAAAPLRARVPIGWIDAAALAAPARSAAWLGGDVLTGAWVLEELGRDPRAPIDPDVPIDGGTLEDLRALAERALAERRSR